jgi:Rhodopirellula transposase DDE domain
MTIRKGMHALDSGVLCVDAFALRGRKRAEVHLPNLLTDIQAIVDSQSQADPQCRTTRLHTRLTAAEVRRQLIAHKGYPDAVLPTAETIGTKLNALGYDAQKVAQSQPQKNSPKPTRSLTR